MTQQVGIIGLGKMGGNTARRLMEKGWNVVGFNRSPDDTQQLATEGMTPSFSVKELVEKLSGPRIIWLMLPAGQPTEDMIFGENGVAQYLEKGDIVVDAGNSLYKDDAPRAKRLEEQGIHYVDVGFSGGPGGARNGACLMVGGTEPVFQQLEPLYRDLATENGYQFFPGFGAGHFVKMVHNGIEYGMMQAIAEGFAVMKQSAFDLDLVKVADVYNHGSVIESRLIGWLQQAYEQHSVELNDISGTVKHTGEGQWTIDAAHELGVPAPVIEDSLEFRKQSETNPSYTGQVLSALRNAFGGHAVK